MAAVVSRDRQRRLELAAQNGDEARLKGRSFWISYPGIKLTEASTGALTAAGQVYVQLAEAAGRPRPELQIFQGGPGAVAVRRTPHREYATSVDGRQRITMQRDGPLGEWRFTRFGQHLYPQGHTLFNVDVPVVENFVRHGGKTDRYDRDAHGQPLTITLTDDFLREHGIVLRHAELLELGRVRDHADVERQKRYIADAVLQYLNQLAANPHNLEPPHGPNDGGTVRDGVRRVVLSEFEASDRYFTFDAARAARHDLSGFRFDLQRTGERAEGRPFVETIMGQPLRGLVVCAETAWNQEGMLAEAWRDFDGDCVCQQLLLALRTARHDGPEHTRRMVPMLTLDEVQCMLDDAQDFMYPGHYEGESPAPAPNLDVAARSALEPYVAAWRAQFSEGRMVLGLRDLMQEHRNGHVFRRDFAGPGWNPALRSAFPEVQGERTGRRGQVPVGVEHYRRFFSSFPEHFRLYGGEKVRLVLPEERRRVEEAAEDVEAQRELVRDPPYSRAGWRQVGPTSHLVLELVKRLGRPVRVICNRRCCWDFVPDDWDERRDRHHAQMLVWNVQGDHAFFYRASASIDAVKLRVVKGPAETPAYRLSVWADAERAGGVPYDQMLEYSDDAFENARRRHGRRRQPDELDENDEEPPPSRHFRARDIRAVQRYLDERRIEYWPRYDGQTGRHLLSISVYLSRSFDNERASRRPGEDLRGPRLVIQADTERAPLLSRICDAFQRQQRLELTYYGEELPSLVDRAMDQLLTVRRTYNPRRGEIARAQDWRCHVCDRDLRQRPFDVHHQRPVAADGDDEPPNLVALCRFPCHADLTEQQRLTCLARKPRLESELSPALTLLLRDCAPKPRQRVYGFGLTPESELPEQVHCLDVVGCRRNALLERPWPLPCFGPRDERRVFAEPPTLAEIVQYDLLWVDRGEPTAFERLYDGAHLYPVDAVVALLELLDVKPEHVLWGLRASRHLATSELRLAYTAVEAAVEEAVELLPPDSPLLLRPSPAQVLERVRRHQWDDGDQLTPELYDGHRRPSVELEDQQAAARDELSRELSLKHYSKEAVLSWLGLCSRAKRFQTLVRRSTVFDQEGRVDAVEMAFNEGGVPYCKTRIELLGNRTKYVLSLIALWVEQINVARAQELTATIPNLRLLGVLVDGVFVDGPAAALDRLEEAAASIVYGTSGRQMLRLKLEPPVKVPRNERPVVDHTAPAPQFAEPGWRLVRDEDGDLIDRVASAGLLDLGDFLFQKLQSPDLVGLVRSYVGEPGHVWDDFDRLAVLVIRNSGGLITGPAGTGKTELIKRLQLLWPVLEPGVRMHTATIKHLTSRLTPTGVTIEHLLHQLMYNHVAGHVFILDEASEIGAGLLARLARWQLLGARFVVVGDWSGQFQPIFDAWPDDDASAPRPLPDSELLRSMCERLHVELRVGRRSDLRHFEFYTGLYPDADAERHIVEARVREARARYPWDGLQRPDLMLCMSHPARVALNAKYNLEDVASRPEAVLVPCAPVEGQQRTGSLPQDMWLWPGLEVVGARGCPKVVNGVWYVVEAATDEAITVRMRRDFWLTEEAVLARLAELPEKRRAAARLRIDRQQAPVQLTLEEASLALRLSYALCYASAQGATVRERYVMLLDTAHRHFTVRSLIVGSSRVTDGRYLLIPTPEQERALAPRWPRAEAGFADDDEDSDYEPEDVEDDESTASGIEEDEDSE